MKVISITSKEKQKKELYKILKYVPNPSKRFGLTTSQNYWWFWFGRELVQTNKFVKLDQVHLYRAAFWLDAKVNSIKHINKLNDKDKNGIKGLVQTFQSGATNITGFVSIIEKADKHLDDISSHFGLSIRDRNKLKQVEQSDPNQTDMFNDFLKQKTM